MEMFIVISIVAIAGIWGGIRIVRKFSGRPTEAASDSGCATCGCSRGGGVSTGDCDDRGRRGATPPCRK
jgi:hypothetical protein